MHTNPFDQCKLKEEKNPTENYAKQFAKSKLHETISQNEFNKTMFVHAKASKVLMKAMFSMPFSRKPSNIKQKGYGKWTAPSLIGS